MAKFYCMGNYTAQAFQGFLKDPTSDRSKAARAAGEAVGAKFISYDALRGSYDFIVVFEGTFDQAAELNSLLKLAERLRILIFVKLSK